LAVGLGRGSSICCACATPLLQIAPSAKENATDDKRVFMGKFLLERTQTTMETTNQNTA
jgi:hypothetical protein